MYGTVAACVSRAVCLGRDGARQTRRGLCVSWTVPVLLRAHRTPVCASRSAGCMEAGKGLGRCLANRIARTTESDKGAGLAQRAAHYRRRAAATNHWTTKYPMEMGELDKTMSRIRMRQRRVTHSRDQAEVWQKGSSLGRQATGAWWTEKR